MSVHPRQALFQRSQRIKSISPPGRICKKENHRRQPQLGIREYATGIKLVLSHLPKVVRNKDQNSKLACNSGAERLFVCLDLLYLYGEV